MVVKVMLPDENKKELEKSEVEKRSLSNVLMIAGTVIACIGFSLGLQIFVALGIGTMIVGGIVGVFKQKKSN
ncbi:MAG: hypothetical protein H6Q70_3538 [Firmicutes bacterium]|nr:hypothetical protein [Bacillota bacterium]